MTLTDDGLEGDWVAVRWNTVREPPVVVIPSSSLGS